MKSGLFILFGCTARGTRQAGLGLRLSSRSGIGENVLQFLRIHMTNCTQPPALNDKWQKSTFQPLPSLPLGCTLIFPVKVRWKAQLDVWMWGFIQTHSVQQLEAACRCFMEPTSKSDKNANIIGFCNILIFGSRGLRSGLGDKALKEDQVYFPRHIRGTSVVQGIYGVNCYTTTYGVPYKSEPCSGFASTYYFPAWAPYMRLGPCFVVVPGSPLACTGSGALGLTEPHNRPCQRRPAGLLEEPWRVCGLLS